MKGLRLLEPVHLVERAVDVVYLRLAALGGLIERVRKELAHWSAWKPPASGRLAFHRVWNVLRNLAFHIDGGRRKSGSIGSLGGRYGRRNRGDASRKDVKAGSPLPRAGRLCGEDRDVQRQA